MNLSKSKKFLLLFILAFLPTFAIQAKNYILKVSDIGGHEASMIVDDSLVLYAKDNQLILSNSSSTVNFIFPEINHISYQELVTTSIDNIKSAKRLPNVSISSNSIIISPCDDIEYSYKIFDISGLEKCSGEGNGATQIDLSTFQSGIYILSVDSLPSIKFIIK